MNNLKKIVITGASGTIGSILMRGLQDKYELVGIDKKPWQDIQSIEVFDLLSPSQKIRFSKILDQADTLIHLAWDTREAGGSFSSLFEESKVNNRVHENNQKMGEIVYAEAMNAGVKKVIMASSVHASIGSLPQYSWPMSVRDEKQHKLLHDNHINTTTEYWPLGPYGASKKYLEALGYACAITYGLPVIAVRFGLVRSDDNPEKSEYPFWLSHQDCVNFIEQCIEFDMSTMEPLPPFTVLFAISDNKCNPFDISKAKQLIGYEPKSSWGCPFNMQKNIF